MGEITEALRRARIETVPAPGAPQPAEGERPASAPKAASARTTLKPATLKSAKLEPAPDSMPRPLPAPKRPIRGRVGFGLAGRDQISLREIYSALLRRRVLAGQIFAGVLALVTVATFVQTPVYESTATLLVKLGREFRNGSEGGRGAGELVTPVSQVINTEIEILRSQEVAESVVAGMGAAVLYPDLAEAAPTDPAAGEADPEARKVATPEAVATRRLATNLRVEAVPETQVVRIAFRHPDPETAAEAVNQVVDRFMERHLWAFSQGRATEFLGEKVATYRGLLDEREEELGSFVEAHPRFAVSDAADVIGRERLKLVAERDSVRRELAAAHKERAHLERLRDSSTSRYENLALRDQLEEQILTVSARISGLTARESSVLGQVAKYDQELGEMPALRKQYDELVRERNSADSLYATYSRQLEEARVSEEMDRQKIANISVLQAGFVPSAPVRPNKVLNLTIGGVAAALLALLTVLGLEALEPPRRRR